MLKKIFAFIKKDLLIEYSYKTSFFMSAFGAVIALAAYFYIDKLFGSRMSPYLKNYGTDYFSYVLLSLALFGYIGVGSGSFSEKIRREQNQGTLELLFLAPMKTGTLLTAMNIWNIIFASFYGCVYISAGLLVFGVSFPRANIISVTIILILSAITFGSLGIMSAAFILVFKRGNPVSWVMGTAEGLLGGVFFPVEVLPGWMRAISDFIPITYAVRAVQLAVYKGYGIYEIGKDIIILALFSAVLLPLSFFIFQKSLNRARKSGNLSHY
jgi:ABC-2 type transport system permease protein